MVDWAVLTEVMNSGVGSNALLRVDRDLETPSFSERGDSVRITTEFQVQKANLVEAILEHVWMPFSFVVDLEVEYRYLKSLKVNHQRFPIQPSSKQRLRD